MDDIRWGVISTPLLAIPAATMAFWSAVVETSNWPMALWPRCDCELAGKSGNSGLCDVRKVDPRHRVVAEQLGLLRHDRDAQLDTELRVAGVAREREHLGHRPATRTGLVAEWLARSVGERLALLHRVVEAGQRGFEVVGGGAGHHLHGGTGGNA